MAARISMPDVIVLLPGILGSALRRNGRDVWALSGGAALRGLLTLGRDIQDLALGEDPPDRDDLGDGVTADRLLPDLQLIPHLWKVDGYAKVSQTIQSTFEVTAGQNFFEFPYDWRRDNRVAARRLARQSQEWLTRWRTSSGNAEARLILIGHSMGGLVSRYFLEVLGGWRTTRALVTFGTPYRGSVNALDSLANGVRKGPLGIVDLSAFVRSLTAVYQLLPIYPCYATAAGLVRIGETTAIPNVDAGKAAAALAFHHEIRDAVDANQRDADYRDHGYRIHPIVGIQQPTFQSARPAADGVELLTSYEGEDQRGDGTVPRVSAMPIETTDPTAGMFAATAHASLQNADAVLTHLTGLISSFYLDLGRFRAAEGAPVRLGLDVEDVYWRDEPVSVDLFPGGAPLDLRAVIADADSGAEVTWSAVKVAEPDRQRLEFRPLPSGAYRIRITGDARVEPVTDVFAVLDRPAGAA